MATASLRQGSRGKLVLELKTLLNDRRCRLPNPLPETEEFDAQTKLAVIWFQKHSKIGVDGVVGPETAGALAKLTGHAAAHFAKTMGAGPSGEDKRGDDKPPAGKGDADGQYVTISVGGKKIVLAQDDFRDFAKQMQEVLRKAVLAADIRAIQARTLWDHFDDMTKDQYVVSWFVSLAGPKLPSESVVKAAEQAVQRLDSAVGSGDFKKVRTELANTSDPVNAAYETMMKYSQAVTGRTGTWIDGLTFTRDKSFEIVEAIATVELGGSAGARVGTGGAGELVKSAAGELGKYIAGTSQGGAAAAKTILLDGVLGAAKGGVSAFMKAKGDKVIEGVAEATVRKLTGKWAARIAAAKMRKFLEKRLEGALKGALEGAVKGALDAVKGNMTPEKFFEEIAKEAGFEAVLSDLDPWFEKKLPEAVYDELSSDFRKKFFGKLGRKESLAVLEKIVGGPCKDAVKKALEVAIDKAKGSEEAEEVGHATAKEFTRSNARLLEAEVIKSTKKA